MAKYIVNDTLKAGPVSSNERTVLRSRDLSGPIRGQGYHETINAADD